MTRIAGIAFTIGVALLAPGALAAQPAAAPTLDDLAFMAGCWRGDSGGGAVLEEYYTTPSANLILGVSRYLRDGRAVQYELSRITADSTGIVLLPSPGGEPSEHAFRLTAWSAASATFEAPEHDFPKRIRYARDPDGALTARIDDGSDDGRAQEWRLLPVPCRPGESSPEPAAAPTEPEAGDALTIRLEHGSEAEAVTARELGSLLEKYDVEPWILTREVVIDQSSIPHSHPVLTLHTRHRGDEPMLLSTFVHEQLHWLEEAEADSWGAAMRELRGLFPEVPDRSQGGARDDESTYRHLLVCDLELQAMTALLGEETARETLARITHYEWIYERVLDDPRVRQVSLRHGFDVRAGVR